MHCQVQYNCPGQVNIALGQVKIEVHQPGGQVTLASVLVSLNKNNVSLISGNFQSEAFQTKTARLVNHCIT